VRDREEGGRERRRDRRLTRPTVEKGKEREHRRVILRAKLPLLSLSFLRHPALFPLSSLSPREEKRGAENLLPPPSPLTELIVAAFPAH
jgi:hypothetical protein